MRDNDLVWHKVADDSALINWQPNNMAIISVGEKYITVLKLGDTIKACAYKCPHAGGIMADGFVDALGNVACPLHRYKFNPGNGRNVSGEGYHLKVYPVEQRSDGVYVGLAPNL